MIKKSITMAKLTTLPGNQLVEYTWMRQQEELIYSKDESNSFKQLIVENIEVFLLLVAILQVISFICVVRHYRRKNRKLQETAMNRKESSVSDDLSMSRKPSADEEPIAKDRSSSTDSSHPEGRLVLKQHIKEPTDERGLVQIGGHTLKISQEKRIEIERDPKTNVITKIETNTLVHQIAPNEETEQQLMELERKLKEQVHIEHGNQTFRGLRTIEHEDMVLGTSFKQFDVVTEWSKHCENGKFQKLYSLHELIGKGTYGEVYKVRKGLDAQLYAVKRIFFSVVSEINLKDHKIFREIEALSRFSHPNIVRYYTSWIEELSTDMLMKYAELQQLAKRQQHQVSESQSIQDFECSYLDDLVQFVGGGDEQQPPIASHSRIEEQQQSFHYSDYSSDAQSQMRRMHFHPNSQAHIYILNIEMEICEKNTLKDFIENVDRVNDLKLIRDIFMQVIQGVKYMHNQNFIHRDLKPQNIFINSKNQVKIGDLGLSTHSFLHIEQGGKENHSPREGMTNNIGTPLYMAPEVKLHQYDFSADVYALGIILFELLWSIKTSHQRSKLIKELTVGLTLPAKFKEAYPIEAKLIIDMTSANPKKRPTAEQIIQILLSI